jgi:hypothetical protein
MSKKNDPDAGDGLFGDPKFDQAIKRVDNTLLDSEDEVPIGELPSGIVVKHRK